MAYTITLCNAFAMILVFYAGEIAGIIAGLVVFLVILCVIMVAYLYLRKRKVMPKFMSLSDICVIESDSNWYSCLYKSI